jgi:hypothetical protein
MFSLLMDLLPKTLPVSANVPAVAGTAGTVRFIEVVKVASQVGKQLLHQKIFNFCGERGVCDRACVSLAVHIYRW